jgi:uncharacterized phage protein gp47/JayE
MPFLRPTLAQIIRRVISDFEYEIGSQAARIPGTIERAFVAAIAGASHGLHGRLAWIALAAFAQSADDVELEKIAALFGIFRIEAERATGRIYFFGNGGTAVPLGTRAVRADGVQYETTEAGEIGGFSVDLASRAVVAGAAGNEEAGTALTLMTPIAGLQSNAEVKTPGMDGGADTETTLALRTRLLAHLADPPNAGGPGSYIAWAKLVAGVTRVWEFGRLDENGDSHLGHVHVLVMRDNDDDPVPSDPELAEVKAKILEFAPLHLLGLHVSAPIIVLVAMTIELTPNGDPDLEAAAETSIRNKFALHASPPRGDGATFYKSLIATAIAETPGVEDYKLTVPAGDITVDQFELLTVGTITWS